MPFYIQPSLTRYFPLLHPSSLRLLYLLLFSNVFPASRNLYSACLNLPIPPTRPHKIPNNLVSNTPTLHPRPPPRRQPPRPPTRHQPPPQTPPPSIAQNELIIYTHLKSLQGTLIPRSY